MEDVGVNYIAPFLERKLIAMKALPVYGNWGIIRIEIPVKQSVHNDESAARLI
jgi:hypothetical protein